MKAKKAPSKKIWSDWRKKYALQKNKTADWIGSKFNTFPRKVQLVLVGIFFLLGFTVYGTILFGGFHGQKLRVTEQITTTKLPKKETIKKQRKMPKTDSIPASDFTEPLKK